MAENLSVFFGRFATESTYDSATAVDVIFDRAFLQSLGVGGTNPTALAKASDFPAGTCIGKTLLVSGTTYTIRGREPVDDGALVLLQLSL